MMLIVKIFVQLHRLIIVHVYVNGFLLCARRRPPHYSAKILSYLLLAFLGRVGVTISFFLVFFKYRVRQVYLSHWVGCLVGRGRLLGKRDEEGRGVDAGVGGKWSMSMVGEKKKKGEI